MQWERRRVRLPDAYSPIIPGSPPGNFFAQMLFPLYSDPTVRGCHDSRASIRNGHPVVSLRFGNITWLCGISIRYSLALMGLTSNTSE